MENQTDIYARAAAELAAVDAQILALEKRRQALRQFVELGQRLFGGTGHADVQLPSLVISATGNASGSFGRPSASTTTRDQSMKARILALCKQALEEKTPRSTRDLLAYVEAAGVEVTGADKPTTVSVILSRAPEFENTRGIGWYLISQKGQTPHDVAASAGSSAA